MFPGQQAEDHHGIDLAAGAGSSVVSRSPTSRLVGWVVQALLLTISAHAHEKVPPPGGCSSPLATFSYFLVVFAQIHKKGPGWKGATKLRARRQRDSTTTLRMASPPRSVATCCQPLPSLRLEPAPRPAVGETCEAPMPRPSALTFSPVPRLEQIATVLSVTTEHDRCPWLKVFSP